MPPQRFTIRPEADREPGCVRRAERGGFGHHGTDNRDAEDVSLELHEQRVHGSAAIDFQHLEPHAGISEHRVQDRTRLKADRLEGRAGEMGLRVEARKSHDNTARVGPPVRREESGERGHEVEPAAVGHAGRQRLDLAGGTDDLELIPEPLHGGPGDGHRPFERVDRFGVGELVRKRGEQSRRGWHGLAAGVQQHEVAGAVGVLGFAGREARLADERGMLIPQVAGDRNLGAHRSGSPRDAERRGIGRSADAGQHPARNPEQRQQLVVPVERSQVHELRAAGIGGVGDMAPAGGPAGQVPDDPAIDRAEQRLAAFGRGTGTVDMVENPLQLGRRKVSRRRQPGARAQQLARRFERGNGAVGARILPDDRVVPRPAGARIPHHGGFPLVGDADGGKVRSVEAGAAQGAGDGLVDARGDLDRVVLDPSGAGRDLPVLELTPGDLAPRARRTR